MHIYHCKIIDQINQKKSNGQARDNSMIKGGFQTLGNMMIKFSRL
jgi:hypothetical protein